MRCALSDPGIVVDAHKMVLLQSVVTNVQREFMQKGKRQRKDIEYRKSISSQKLLSHPVPGSTSTNHLGWFCHGLAGDLQVGEV